ncbi:MAG: YbgA family protein [Bacillota bacterium]|nr:YbgA family protein [Bacillota bacterium]
MSALEEEWANYKYLVLSRSSKIYNEIRELLKKKSENIAIKFYTLIEQALALSEDRGAEINAAQHIWGYVNKDCCDHQKNRFQKLLKDYDDEGKNLKALKNHLLKLSIAQDIGYLKKSYYFYID